MVKIVLDCFGGDLSPDSNVQGAIEYFNENKDVYIIMTGKEDILRQKLQAYTYDTSRLEIQNADEVISLEEKPTEAIRRTNTSMVRAFDIVKKDDSIAGMVSLGSTGALLVGTFLRIGRLKNVLRPAFCPIIPNLYGGRVAICDSGANAECTPQYLRQFAVMGSRYLEAFCGVKNPKVGLLNIGVEKEKGDRLRQEAYELLENTECVNFQGNMESRELLTGKFDLIVCDGFSGNVLLKSTEGACFEMLRMLKGVMTSSTKNKLGALLLKNSIMEQKELLNYQNYGGAVMLGAKKIVVKGHGNGNATSVKKCLDQVYTMQMGDINGKIEQDLAKLAEASSQAKQGE